MNHQKFDIAIIGSSFVGMSCALAMAKISPQISVAIIEKQNVFDIEKSNDGRAFAISSSSLDFFKEIAILENLQNVSGKISDIKITDYKSPFILDFISEEFEKNHQHFGAIIENHYIFEELKKKVLQQKNITIFCPNYYQEINFSDDLAKILLDDNNLVVAKLLLACDGRFSKLRQQFNISTLTKNYHQTAIVFKISHQFSHQNIAHEKFLPSGPLAILPLADKNQSSIVWIVDDEQAQVLLELDQQNFIQQLTKKIENCLGDCQIISEKFSYPLTLILADKFYHKKMLLVGDSACGVHPIAGQGFNLAISNIAILQKLIATKIILGLDFSSDSIISEYNNLARQNSKKMVIATDLLNTIFEAKCLTISIARKLGLGVVNNISQLKKFFISNAGGFTNKGGEG